jgi:hypothetical protein
VHDDEECVVPVGVSRHCAPLSTYQNSGPEWVWTALATWGLISGPKLASATCISQWRAGGSGGTGPTSVTSRRATAFRACRG